MDQGLGFRLGIRFEIGDLGVYQGLGFRLAIGVYGRKGCKQGKDKEDQRLGFILGTKDWGLN